MVEKAIGIDLGTTNISIYKKRKGIVLKEPSMIAIDRETNEPVAFGYEAKRLLGRTPDRINIIKPIQHGVITDFEMTEKMLNYFLKKVKIKSLFRKPVILMSCPLKITKVEENALREVADRMDCRDVYLVEAIKASALGAGMDIAKPKGNMIIDIGGGIIDIAILSYGTILKGFSIEKAGNYFDQKIASYMKQKYKLLIGERTAEEIKIEVSSFLGDEKTIKTCGRDLITNLPHTIELTSQDIKEALQEDIYHLIDIIKELLEDIQPEIAADIASSGIVLTGGGSLLCGLDKLLSFELGIPVTNSEDNMDTTVEGLGILLENVHQMEYR